MLGGAYFEDIDGFIKEIKHNLIWIIRTDRSLKEMLMATIISMQQCFDAFTQFKFSFDKVDSIWQSFLYELSKRWII
jgi:hypothetical protein